MTREASTQAADAVGTPDTPPPVPFFEWFTALAVHMPVSGGRDKRWRLAMLVGKSTTGTSGKDASLDEDTLCGSLGVSRSRLYEIWREVLDDGWFIQTALPTRGTKHRRGRRARFQLSLPNRVRELSVEPGHDSEVTDERIVSGNPAESCPETQRIVSRFSAQKPDRLPYDCLPTDGLPPRPQVRNSLAGGPCGTCGQEIQPDGTCACTPPDPKERTA